MKIEVGRLRKPTNQNQCSLMMNKSRHWKELQLKVFCQYNIGGFRNGC